MADEEPTTPGGGAVKAPETKYFTRADLLAYANTLEPSNIQQSFHSLIAELFPTEDIEDSGAVATIEGIRAAAQEWHGNVYNLYRPSIEGLTEHAATGEAPEPLDFINELSNKYLGLLIAALEEAVKDLAGWPLGKTDRMAAKFVSELPDDFVAELSKPENVVLLRTFINKAFENFNFGDNGNIEISRGLPHFAPRFVDAVLASVIKRLLPAAPKVVRPLTREEEIKETIDRR